MLSLRINYTLIPLNLLFRSIHPSQSRVAARHLSQSANDLNMKRLWVNVQITAMISTIEFLFYFSHQVWVRLAGGTNEVAVFFVIVWYMFLFMILSPYAFLMNTSHNKNRIIDDGWINVFKNITINSTAFESITKFNCCREQAIDNERNDLPENGNVEISSVSDKIQANDQTVSSPTLSNETPENKVEKGTTDNTDLGDFGRANRQNDLPESSKSEVNTLFGDNPLIDRIKSSPACS